MKAIIIFALVSLTFIEVFGGSIYGEKEDVKAEVDKKFQEVNEYLTSVKSHITEEKNKIDDNSKNDAKKAGEKTQQVIEGELKTQVVSATRTAIAKGKPLTAIECIAKAVVDGDNLIDQTAKNHIKAVDEVLPNKLKKLKFLDTEIKLIELGLEGLKKEFDEKLGKATSGFQALKADGIKKANSARKQLEDIEKVVDKPTLFEEYTNAKRKMEAKYAEIKQTLLKRLQQCVA